MGHNNSTQVVFKNCAPFIKCIRQIHAIIIDDAEDLALVVLMYNFMKHSWNYSDTTGSFCFYSKAEATKFDAAIANTNSFKSFNYASKLLGNTTAAVDNAILENITITVTLKY